MSFLMIVMTKCKVLFLVGLMVAVGGCDAGIYPDDTRCASVGCLENVKKSAFPCVNEQDIKVRLELIHRHITEKRCFTCANYQKLYCREMLDGLKK